MELHLLDNQLSQLWQQGAEDPRATLVAETLSLIAQRQYQSLRYRVALFGISFLAAVAGTVVAIALLTEQILLTGFGTLVSSFFTDFSAVITHGSDFLFSILETLPAFELITSLAGVLAVVVLGKMVVGYMRMFKKDFILIQ